jgi:DNA/RNA endonuclease YhcR with UshA esterase domain
MKKSTLFTLLFCFGFLCISSAQTINTTVSYSLKRTFLSNSNAAVGGDLVISPDQPSTNLPICSPKNESFQDIYRGATLNAVFLKVNNNIGNNCVTLVVVTETGTLKETIAASSESGLLKFLKVKSIKLQIDQLKSATFPQTLDARGNVDIWF